MLAIPNADPLLAVEPCLATTPFRTACRRDLEAAVRNALVEAVTCGYIVDGGMGFHHGQLAHRWGLIRYLVVTSVLVILWIYHSYLTPQYAPLKQPSRNKQGEYWLVRNIPERWPTHSYNALAQDTSSWSGQSLRAELTHAHHVSANVTSTSTWWQHHISRISMWWERHVNCLNHRSNSTPWTHSHHLAVYESGWITIS